MKIPVTPPKLGDGSGKPLNFFSKIFRWNQPASNNGEYIHWDKLRHLQPPENFSAEEWWFAVKLARQALYKSLPFDDKYGKPMLFAASLDEIVKKCHAIDRKTGNPLPVLNSDMRDTYLVSSLIEEAITSSQLEGASTSRRVAKEMLQSSRKPRDKSEQMIFNNYHAMQFVREIKNENITPQAILELHRILSIDTLEDAKMAGNLRGPQDDIHVWDNIDGQLLHTPPAAKELKSRLTALCHFANMPEDDDKFFIHPVVKAILLHFVLAYDHPFVDGNGRTARALFYWCMAKQGYTLMEFVSISKILKETSSHYARAYLYTETDENDVTYFVIFQLNVILKAIDSLYKYLDSKTTEIHKVEKLLQANKSLRNKLNHRQLAIIKHALKHLSFDYRIAVHQQLHNITYQTARTDLLDLVTLGLLKKNASGKAFTFTAVDNLKTRILGKTSQK